MKFSSVLTSNPSQAACRNGVNMIKRDYIYVEFLRVAQEVILLKLLSTPQEIESLC
jgi:hypothetical protein